MIVVDVLRIAATKRRIRLMTNGKRCTSCGRRFGARGCIVGPGGRPGHVRHVATGRTVA
jgi:hypothetical protein